MSHIMFGDDVKTHTQSPTCMGASVIGLCFTDGVVIAADNLASWGRMARFPGCSRLLKVNDKTIAGSSGDYADFQYLTSLIERKQIEEETHEDGFELSARSLHSWLTRVQYNRRNKMDPLWTSWAVGGIDSEGPYLGFVNKLGAAFKDKLIGIGFGSQFAMPLLRKYHEEKKGQITRVEAIEFVKKCMSTIFLRDCSAHPEFEIAVVDSTGSEILGPLRVNTDWSLAAKTRGMLFAQ
ncbi:proteasome subunit beta type-4 [Brevipalpus obovatus]|uniref:proteasome subunit beta type-4 n=1 Tax=Brevipalpus obovatus TaxID=246614 RepID=UPI003D9F15B9